MYHRINPSTRTLFTYLISLLISAFIVWSCDNEEEEEERPPVPAETPPPTITSFAPESGTVGSSVTINGTNFSDEPDDNIVVFGNESGVTITNASTDSLTVTVPQGAETGKISVTVNGKTATSANDFTVEVSDLAITSFTPSSGNVGASVTINGTNFNPTIAGNTVIFYNNKEAVVTSASSNSLTVTVPQGVETGKISVTANGKTVTSADDFTVGVSDPTITSFTPNSGNVGASVTITGTNFSSTVAENTVIFHDNKEATITNASTNSLTVTVPQGVETGKISVTVNGKTATSANDFTVDISDPTITSFTPNSGKVGTSVTITGTNFSSTVAENTVIFHDNKEATITNASTNSLTVTAPQGVETGKISVTVDGKTTTSADDFMVEVSDPTITSFTPNSGNVGTSVTITGTNFSSTIAENTVTFHNNKEAAVTNASSNSLTVTVPQGVETGKISVTVDGKTATSADNFTVDVSDPTITSFTPSSGNVGASVTITGTNFSSTIAENTVTFHDNKEATITNASTNSLTVTVPQCVITGKISVTVNGKTVTSANDFTVMEQDGAVCPCTQALELGPNESCSLSFDSGNTVIFSVDDEGTACLDDDECYDSGLINTDKLEKCYSNLLAFKQTSGKWFISLLPKERPTIGSGCAQCEGSMPESCLGGHIESGDIISSAGNNSWTFNFSGTSTFVSSKDSEGNQRQLYFLLKNGSGIELSGFNSGVGAVPSTKTPGVSIYVINVPRFSGKLACDKNIEFAFIARSPFEILEKQNPTYITYKGSDFCNTLVSLIVRGKK